MRVAIARALIWVTPILFVAVHSLCAGEPADIPLPKSVVVHQLIVTADRTCAFIAAVRPGRDDVYPPSVERGWFKVDTKTGELTNVLRWIDEGKDRARIGVCRLSPDETKLAVCVVVPWEGQRMVVMYVVDVKTGRKEMDRTFDHATQLNAVWAGSQLLYTVVLEDGAVEHVSHDDGKPCGLVVAGSPSPKLAYVAADPKNPRAAIKMPELRTKAHILAIDDRGRILDDLGPAEKVPGDPVVSPSGKYMAYRLSTADGLSLFRTTVGGKDRVAMKDTWPPIAVTDAGLVVAIHEKYKGPTSIMLLEPGKKSRELAGDVTAATVVGERLYYVKRGGTAISSMKVPVSIGE